MKSIDYTPPELTVHITFLPEFGRFRAVFSGNKGGMKFARYYEDARQRAYLSRSRKARERAWLVLSALVIAIGVAAWIDESYGPTVQAYFFGGLEKLENIREEWDGFAHAAAQIESWWKY